MRSSAEGGAELGNHDERRVRSSAEGGAKVGKHDERRVRSSAEGGAKVIDDLPARYHEYLERVSKELGDIAVGAFAKWSGKLIKKLSFEEFTPAFLEHADLVKSYYESIERGDTINDVVLRLIRDKSAALILPPPRLA